MSQMERTYSDPDINMETAVYWESAKNGKLLVKTCKACGKLHYYPRTICPHCLSSDTDWVEASGKGTIYTYSVMRRTETPYVIAYVTLEEGVTMLSNIVECDVDGVAVGQTVEVVFRDTEGGHSLPVFRPA
jgi:uncharacterized OB-fold protein|tara:strand:- start:152 stop:544 length:393 start_codon:yes stop_codon:yes gene_type:complete